jgi:hypothetical protein
MDTLDQAVITVQNWPTPATADGGKIGCQPNFGQVCLSNHPAIVGLPQREKLQKSRKDELRRIATLPGQPPQTPTSTIGNRRESWATPRAGKTTDENPETWVKRQAQGDVATMPLTAQVKCWATPTARDHKSGRGQEERDYKELTPMVERTQSGKLNPRWVETLMGLPVGWTMPSCAYPVTIEPTNSDCSVTESSHPQQKELF